MARLLLFDPNTSIARTWSKLLFAIFALALFVNYWYNQIIKNLLTYYMIQAEEVLDNQIDKQMSLNELIAYKLVRKFIRKHGVLRCEAMLFRGYLDNQEPFTRLMIKIADKTNCKTPTVVSSLDETEVNRHLAEDVNYSEGRYRSRTECIDVYLKDNRLMVYYVGSVVPPDYIKGLDYLVSQLDRLAKSQSFRSLVVSV